jgi:hypothetical protein
LKLAPRKIDRKAPLHPTPLWRWEKSRNSGCRFAPRPQPFQQFAGGREPPRPLRKFLEAGARDRIHPAIADEVFSEMRCHDAESTLALEPLLLSWVNERVELHYTLSV